MTEQSGRVGGKESFSIRLLFFAWHNLVAKEPSKAEKTSKPLPRDKIEFLKVACFFSAENEGGKGR